MYLQLSFSFYKSKNDLIVSSNFIPTTIPGPTEHGPCINKNSLEPVFDEASNNDNDIFIAEPVALNGLSSDGITHGSTDISLIILIKLFSHSLNGYMNFLILPVAEAPRGSCLVDKPSISCIYVVVYSLAPRNAYDLLHSVLPNSCTNTNLSNVTKPTNVSGDKKFRHFNIESLIAFNSSSGIHLSITNKNILGLYGI